MPMDVVCPKCGNGYQVSRKMVGKRLRCKGCGGEIEVKAAAPAGAGVATGQEGAGAADYDLTALAAAEDAAQPLEERVYVPPTVAKPPKKQPKPGQTTVHQIGRRGDKVKLVGWRWWLVQPWPYAQVVALGLVAVACAGNLEAAKTGVFLLKGATILTGIWGVWLALLVTTNDNIGMAFRAVRILPILPIIILSKSLANPGKYKMAGLALLNAAIFGAEWALIAQAVPAALSPGS